MAGSLIRTGSWTSTLQKEKEKAVYLLLRSISTTVSELGIDKSTGITKPVGICVVMGVVVVCHGVCGWLGAGAIDVSIKVGWRGLGA